MSVTDSGAETAIPPRQAGQDLADVVLTDLTRSGLGLKIVHTLVESDLGGTLEREELPGGGMRVTVRLPVGPAD